MRILSLGAGVQSTTLALMAAEGEIGPMPDAAIFADTQWEPAGVYAHLDRLEKLLPFPVYRVTAGNIRNDLTDNGRTTRFAMLPLYSAGPDGEKGQLPRQCTKEYKLEPIRRRVSELCEERGLKKRPGTVEMMIGISWDEAHRMKPSNVQYLVNAYPLVDRRMTRRHCVDWLTARGHGVPGKSSCIGCPFHGDAYWIDMRRDQPEEFADAVAFDREIRHLPRLTQPAFIHNSLRPLGEVQFRHEHQIDAFDAECEGMCGN